VGEYRTAYIYYRKALTLDGTNPLARRRVSILAIFLSHGEMSRQERIARFKQSFRDFHDDPYILLMMAKILYSQEEYDGSRAYARRASDLDPTYPEAWAFLARLARKDQNTESALRYDALAIEHAPDYGPYRKDAAVDNLKAEHLEEARHQLRMAFQNTGHYDSYIRMSLDDLLDGRYESALLIQSTLMERAEFYLSRKPDKDAWCLFSGAERTCLTRKSDKLVFLHFYHWLSLRVAGKDSAAERMEQTIVERCESFQTLDLAREAVMHIVADLLEEGAARLSLLNQASERIRAFC
jgi:tetratricopeptide (TPR) repeat protein